MTNALTFKNEYINRSIPQDASTKGCAVYLVFALDATRALLECHGTMVELSLLFAETIRTSPVHNGAKVIPTGSAAARFCTHRKLDLEFAMHALAYRSEFPFDENNRHEDEQKEDKNINRDEFASGQTLQAKGLRDANEYRNK